MKVIHIYNFQSNYGIADFLRGALNVFSFCKKRNYEYFIDFCDTPFKDCFNIPECPKYQIDYFFDFGQRDRDGTFREQELEQFLSNFKEIKIQSNCINITQELYTEEFMEFIKPSQKVMDYIYSLDLPKDYLSIHVRLGDSLINQESNYEIPMDLVKNWNEESLPVFLFTDNSALRKKYSDVFLTTQHEIIHTNAQDVRDKTDSTIFIKTIAEFYLIGFSKKVLALKYSGFSHLSSYLYKKELSVPWNNGFNYCHYKYLNDYIKKIE
jgi:hypothetical protein